MRRRLEQRNLFPSHKREIERDDKKIHGGEKEEGREERR